jgi:hypothetical protein
MDIQANVTYLAALSLAAERLVEILRGFPLIAFPKNPSGPYPQGSAENLKVVREEAKRTAKINALSLLTGIVSAALAYLIGALPADNWGYVIIFGVLAGAGSGFWNAVLSYLLQLKNLTNARATYAAQPPVEVTVLRAAA